MIDSSRSNATISSASSSPPTGPSTSTRRWPLPSYPSRRDLTSAGSPVSASGPKRAVGIAEPPEQLLLDEPVLAQLEGKGRRQGRNAADRLDRHVLELVRDDVGSGREARERGRVVVGSHDQLSDLGGRRIRRRVEEAEAEPEREPGEPEHPPELAASDARDERHRREGQAAGSGPASTALVCSAR